MIMSLDARRMARRQADDASEEFEEEAPAEYLDPAESLDPVVEARIKEAQCVPFVCTTVCQAGVPVLLFLLHGTAHARLRGSRVFFLHEQHHIDIMKTYRRPLILQGVPRGRHSAGARR